GAHRRGRASPAASTLAASLSLPLKPIVSLRHARTRTAVNARYARARANRLKRGACRRRPPQLTAAQVIRSGDTENPPEAPDRRTRTSEETPISVSPPGLRPCVRGT